MSSQATNTPLAAAPPAHLGPTRRLSERLDALIDELHHGEPVNIGKIVAAIRGRAYRLLLIVLRSAEPGFLARSGTPRNNQA